MKLTAADIRKAIESNWKEYLSCYGNLFSSDFVSGASPPSVFVGSYGYPKVQVGPLVPPVHGDTSILDSPERWSGKSLEDIVNYRLNLVRGVQSLLVSQTQGKYIEKLQEVAMSLRPIDSDISFIKNTIPVTSIDEYSPPFGPLGEIKSAKFSSSSSDKTIQRVFYDRDLLAQDSVMELYNRGIEITRIQKCFSVGMLGKSRKLVPTRWSITTTDDIISSSLVSEILDFDLIDSCNVFSFSHIGNYFAVIIFPHRWIFEMEEAWYDQQGNIGFGADFEDARGIDHYPSIAGAYFAAKLAVAEYLIRNKVQAAALVLREIRPEYAVPVGVWQIREGVRMAMKQNPHVLSNFEEAVDFACKAMSVTKSEWFAKGTMLKHMKQKSITDFF